MSAMPILNPRLDPPEIEQKQGSKRGVRGEKPRRYEDLDNLVVKCFDNLRVIVSPTIPLTWIGAIIGPVHDNGLNGSNHIAYLFCNCNLGKIARFKECGIRVTDWKYLENWV